MSTYRASFHIWIHSSASDDDPLGVDIISGEGHVIFAFVDYLENKEPTNISNKELMEKLGIKYADQAWWRVTLEYDYEPGDYSFGGIGDGYWNYHLIQARPITEESDQ